MYFKQHAVFTLMIAAAFSKHFDYLTRTHHISTFADSNSKDNDWWKTAVIYQIYPRSFKDSNDDGIGDLKGIISKVDFLKNLGVTAVWLSPIFQSPGVDQGYDISDYRSVDEIFGSNEDLRNLINALHEAGIKIILDFVPNHTSTDHSWFINSLKGTDKYKDYYVWRDSPNNWISNFSGSAWEYSEKRKQYYLHSFAVEQADLNYRNAEVVTEMMDILTFYMEMNVDGFRIDAVPYIYEDNGFKDEPLVSGASENKDDYNTLNHIYTICQPETYQLIYKFRKHVDNYVKKNNLTTKVIISEAYATLPQQMRFYGDSTSDGAHLAFNFNFIMALTNKNFAVDDIINSINLWFAHLPQGRTSNWVLGNHDNHRVASRFGKQNVDGFNMLNAILPGAMVTYNGEEIGMEDGEVTCKQKKDPQVKSCSDFEKLSRDFERTPYQWDNTEYAGFTNGKSPWLPVSSKKNEVNVADQNVQGKASHLNVYKQLIEFRKRFQTSSSTDGLTVTKLEDTVLEIIRKRDEGEYILLFNVGENEKTFNFLKTASKYEVLITSINSAKKVGDVVEQVTLKPHESLILVDSGVSSALRICYSSFALLTITVLLSVL